jgi:hypothetical protein
MVPRHRFPKKKHCRCSSFGQQVSPNRVFPFHWCVRIHTDLSRTPLQLHFSSQSYKSVQGQVVWHKSRNCHPVDGSKHLNFFFEFIVETMSLTNKPCTRFLTITGCSGSKTKTEGLGNNTMVTITFSRCSRSSCNACSVRPVAWMPQLQRCRFLGGDKFILGRNTLPDPNRSSPFVTSMFCQAIEKNH